MRDHYPPRNTRRAPAPVLVIITQIGNGTPETGPDLDSRRSGHAGFLLRRVHILHSGAEIEYVDEFSYETGRGVIVTLDELDATLRLISHGPHRWTANLEQELVEDRQISRRCCARIRYTNPEFADMPTEISYLFPAFSDATFSEAFILVCLHPSLAIPVVKGLYFEEGSLKHDLLEDWQRFWPPLRRALSRSPIL